MEKELKIPASVEDMVAQMRATATERSMNEELDGLVLFAAIFNPLGMLTREDYAGELLRQIGVADRFIYDKDTRSIREISNGSDA